VSVPAERMSRARASIRAFVVCGDRLVELPQGESVIGRDLRCWMVLNEPTVSRAHLRLLVDNDITAQDMGSANGTLLNGRLLRGARALSDGDELLIGSEVLRIRVIDLAATDWGDETQRVGLQPARLSGRTALGVGAFGDERSVTEPGVCPVCGGEATANGEECATCRGDRDTANRRVTAPATPAARSTAVSQRRHHRQRVEVDVRYRSASVSVESTTRNLSVSGAFIVSRRVDAVGTECSLTFPSPRAGNVIVNGVVRHVAQGDGVGDEVGMGVEFVDVDREARRWLGDVLRDSIGVMA